MTFRGRLRLFFAIMVVVPLLAIGAVLWSLVASSEDGKADARLDTGLRVAATSYQDGRRQADGELPRFGRDGALTAALSAGRTEAVRSRLRTLARRPAIAAVRLQPATGAAERVGGAPAVAFARARLRSSDGRPLGTLSLSTTSAAALAADVARRADVQLVVLRSGDRLGASARAPSGMPLTGDFSSGGLDYRGMARPVGRENGETVRLVAATGRAGIDQQVSDSRRLIVAILLGFLVLALVSSALVARALQDQIAQFLAAARRLAAGDFEQPVPVVGHDQFAELGREFNRMSEQVRVQLEEVERGRKQAERTLRQVGTAFASGLDSQAVIELTVQTAVEACAAEVGFAIPFAFGVFHEFTHGDATPAHQAARHAAERSALAVRAGTGQELMRHAGEGEAVEQRAPCTATVDGVHALAQPLRARLDSGGLPEFVGVVSVSRRSGPFADSDAEQLEYLAGQAAISLENAALHRMAQEQALTDELTGLPNVREMQRALDRELERGHRFDAPVSFVILDLDDFKQINDTYGHQQGDQVLVEVGSLLRRLSRDIDEPARYGGEELAVVLAQTDLQGALHAAERMRSGIEALSIPRVDGHPDPITLTASFGVASVQAATGDKRSLIAAADAALYRAKRAGKNRVEAAGFTVPAASRDG